VDADDLELAGLVAVGGVAALAATRRAARAEPLREAFGDGRAYEAMARGNPGAPPFNRRVLMPALARVLARACGRSLGQGDDPTPALRAVALAGTAAGAALTGALTARAARGSGARRGRAGAAGVLAGALLVAAPHGARLAAAVPAFNDGLAAATGTAWLLGRRGPAGPALLGLAALAREQWILVAAAVMPAHRATLATGALAGAVIAAQPAAPGGEVYPLAVSARRFATREGLLELAWALLLVPGALPVLLRPRARAVRAERRVAAVQVALGLAGGSDSPRLLHGALPALLAAAIGPAVARRDRRLAPAVLVTLAAWRPRTAMTPSLEGYESHFLPYMHAELGGRLREDAARRALAGLSVLGWRAVAGSLRGRGRGPRRSPAG